MKKLMYAPAVAIAVSSLCLTTPVTVLANDDTAVVETNDASTAETTQQTNEVTTQQDQSQYTAPNHVETEVTDENKQGSSIDYESTFLFWPTKKHVDITPDDVEAGKSLNDISKQFGSFGNEKADKLVVKGDLSIAKSGEDAYDTQDQDTYQVEKNSTYNLKADLDVSQITNTINGMSKMVGNSDSVYVNNLETGMRATFSMDKDLEGTFYIPSSEAEMNEHYQLVSTDGKPLIYKINYQKSTFTPDKVTIIMDLDLSKMTALANAYPYADANHKQLYGEGNTIENFNHTEDEYGVAYQTSVFGNLKNLINKGAQSMSMFIKDIVINDAHRATDDPNTRHGSFIGTLTGYFKANTGHNRSKGKVSFTWGAMHKVEGKDSTQKEGDRSISLTVHVKDEPNQPEQPEQPEQPNQPEQQTTAAQTPNQVASQQVQNQGVQTGVEDGLVSPAIAMMAASAGIMTLLKKRKDQE